VDSHSRLRLGILGVVCPCGARGFLLDFSGFKRDRRITGAFEALGAFHAEAHVPNGVRALRNKKDGIVVWLSGRNGRADGVFPLGRLGLRNLWLAVRRRSLRRGTGRNRKAERDGKRQGEQGSGSTVHRRSGGTSSKKLKLEAEGSKGKRFSEIIGLVQTDGKEAIPQLER